MTEKDDACFTCSKKKNVHIFLFQINFKFWFPYKKVQLTAEAFTHQLSVDEKIISSKVCFVKENQCQPKKKFGKKCILSKKSPKFFFFPATKIFSAKFLYFCEIFFSRKFLSAKKFWWNFFFTKNKSFLLYKTVGDIYRYTYWRIRAYLPVHLAAIASKDSCSNSCGVDCTDRGVCCLGIEAT